MDVLSSGEPEPGRESAPAWVRPDELYVSDDELAAFETFELPGDGELDVEDAFGEHDIEYWVWDGNRLIPAPPNKLARIHELEALDRLTWQRRLASEPPPMRGPSASPAPASLFAAALHGVAAFAGRFRGVGLHARAGHAPSHDAQREPEHSLTHEYGPPG